MPFDYKLTSKIALGIFSIGCFFVSSLKSQNFNSFSFGGSGVETINSIILSPDTLILSGTFNQSFQWGDFYLEPKGNQDFFIAGTDLKGRPIFLFTGGSFRDDDITNIIQHPNGTMILGGTYWGEGFFLDTLFANPNSSKNGFLTAFTPGGIPVWRNFINGSGGIEIKSLALLGPKIYVAGTFENTLAIGDTIIYADYPQNLWIAEFNDQGTLQKVTQFNATKNLDLIKMIALPRGDLVLGGQFNESLIFPKDTLKANTLDDDIFILALDDQLELIWKLKGGGVHRDALIDLASNHQNQIIAVGDFVGRLLFADGEELNSGDGIGDAFLISFDQNGKILWQKKLGGMDFQGTHALHTTHQSLIVGGSFESQLLIENEIVAASTEIVRQVFLSSFDFNGTYQETEIFQNSAQFFPSQIIGTPPNIGLTGSFADTLLIGNQSFESPANYQALIVNLNPSTTPIYNPYLYTPTLQLFPNPANDLLQWRENLTFKKVILYHYSGQKILEIDSPNNTIYLPPLPPGPYFLRFFDVKGMGYTATFIKY